MQTVPNQPRRHPVRRVRVEVLGGTGVAASDSITVGTARDNDLTLTDPRVSRYHLRVRASGRDVVLTDLGSTNGTRIGAAILKDGSVTLDLDAVVSLGDTTLKISDGGVDMVDLHATGGFGGLVGRSTAMRELLLRTERAAVGDAPVLILGESGTGKELIARALHEHGPRAQGPMVTVDGGALTPSLYASELFGHERGAFTGAVHRHVGAYERANRGTLFLDEVGELDPAMQAALLGAIERGRIRRLGGASDVDVEVRLVCATHRDLRARVNDERFRLDLYYRLAVIVLETPPLRERPEDIEPLVDHFLRLAEAGVDARTLFTADQLRQLRLHSWPGNVRELRNVVLRALAAGQGAPLALDDASAVGNARMHAPPSVLLSRPFKEARRSVLDQFEASYLQHLLERNGGSLRKSAREAGIDRSYLLQLLRKHGLRE
jgi:DNA-binding NtrC family response regulator